MNEDEDVYGKLQFLFVMIRERLEVAVTNATDHNLLLLSFCMAEIVKSGEKLTNENVDKMVDFLVQIMCDMLMLYENITLRLPDLSESQRIFLPITSLNSEMAALVPNPPSGIFPFADETESSAKFANGLQQLFKMISEYSADGCSYANRIFQSYFAIFFNVCQGQARAGKEFSPTQKNELIKASVIIECSSIYENFTPLKTEISAFSPEEVKAKKGEILLVRRIVAIMAKVLANQSLLDAPELLALVEKSIQMFCTLSAVKSTVRNRLFSLV